MNRLLTIRRRGFSLLELLTVVAIIAALAALLLPALARTRRISRMTVCESNLRNWAMAAQTYATNNDGYLPRRGQGVQPTIQISRPSDWFNALPPLMAMQSYMQLASTGNIPRGSGWGVWSCPEAVDSGQTNFFSYAMDMRLSTWDAPNPDRVTTVGPADSMVFMTDGPIAWCSTLPASAPCSAVARHGARVPIAFLDGHVCSYAGQEVGCGIGDPNRPDVRWSVPGSPWAGPAD